MPKTKIKALKAKLFPPAKTPEQYAALRRDMKILEHRNAIAAAHNALPLMGQKWVDGVVAYRTQCLERLGVKP